MNAAVVSYNTFAEGEENGWKSQGGNRVLLLQNSKGDRWGVPIEGGAAVWTQAVTKQLDPHWAQLVAEMANIDLVMMYVGSHGSERAIRLAAEHGLTADRAAFVLCDCNLGSKMSLIRESGFGDSRIIFSECGGHDSMLYLYEHLLRTGGLPQ